MKIAYLALGSNIGDREKMLASALEKLQARARSHSQELEDLFAQDAAEQAKSAGERAAS